MTKINADDITKTFRMKSAGFAAVTVDNETGRIVAVLGYSIQALKAIRIADEYRGYPKLPTHEVLAITRDGKPAAAMT